MVYLKCDIALDYTTTVNVPVGLAIYILLETVQRRNHGFFKVTLLE